MHKEKWWTFRKKEKKVRGVLEAGKWKKENEES